MTMGNCGEGCLTKKSLIDKLTAIIDIEAKKPYELMDDALVAECADFLMELEEKDKLCDAEVEQRVALIFGTDKTARVKRHNSIRALIIAACLAALLFAAGVVAAAFGFDAISALKQLGTSLVEMVAGDETQIGDISIVKNNGYKVYGSVDSFFAEEKIKVLYPSALPKDAEIDGVYFASGKTPEELFFKFNNADFNYQIELDSFLPSVIKDNAVKAEVINNFTVYFEFINDGCQCVFEHNGDVYTIGAPAYEDIVLIINNLKENDQ